MAKVFKKGPLISIIVPVYNCEKYLNECLNSIINQTYSNLEIILVDDGSKDNSGAICDKYAENDKRVKVFHSKNHGVSFTRNFGIKHANGEYIGFVDADDYIDKRMFEILLNNSLKYDAEISICDVSRNPKKLGNIKNRSIIVYNQHEYVKKYFRIGSQTCEYYPVNKLYRKSVIADNFFPIKYHEGEDTYGVLKTILNSNKFVYCQQVLYYYRVNNSSATSSYSDTDWELIDVWDDIVDLVSATDYVEYAKLNRKRLDFTMLMRMALNVKTSVLKKDEKANKLLASLKKNEKYLLKSSMRFDRKILIFAFCRNYFFVSKLLYFIKNKKV